MSSLMSVSRLTRPPFPCSSSSFIQSTSYLKHAKRSRGDEPGREPPFSPQDHRVQMEAEALHMGREEAVPLGCSSGIV